MVCVVSAEIVRCYTEQRCPISLSTVLRSALSVETEACGLLVSNTDVVAVDAFDQMGVRFGRWSDLNEAGPKQLVNGTVFFLAIDHGTSPHLDSTDALYFILPAATLPPTEVLERIDVGTVDKGVVHYYPANNNSEVVTMATVRPAAPQAILTGQAVVYFICGA